MASVWPELYEARAFKPAPSLWELAEAHVPFSDLGVDRAPETPIRNALEERDGVALLMGPSGGGKSSVLAYVASQITGQHVDPDGRHRYLPLFLPVAARPDTVGDVDTFGRGVILETCLALGTQLDDDQRARLNRAVAEQVVRQRTPPRFNARLVGRVPGLSGDVGVTLANEIVSVADVERLDNHGGLRTLGDIVRAHGHELLVLVEDTDAWASMSSGEAVAEGFFTRVLRPLASDVDLGVAVAVQSRWRDLPAYRDLAERAVAAVEMPNPPSGEQALEMVRSILLRRALRGADPASLGTDPVATLFTDDAIQTLAAELIESSSIRAPLTRVRDTLDRFADALPERIDREHLLESF